MQVSDTNGQFTDPMITVLGITRVEKLFIKIHLVL